MVEVYEPDYGHKVKILSGRHAGREGIVTRGYLTGEVGVSFSERPVAGKADSRQKCSNIEIISREAPEGLNPDRSQSISVFDHFKIDTARENPDMILNNPENYKEYIVLLARYWKRE